MKWWKLLLQLLPNVGSLIKFTFEGLADWIKKTIEERGKLRFFGGVVGLVIIVAVVVAGTIESKKVDPPSPPPPPPPPPPTTVSTHYVEDMLYDGAIYTGYIDPETRQPHGTGKMQYYDGGVYDGEWVNGKQEGTGTMKYRNGDVYEGEWKDNMKDGSGKYSWSDGKTYEGGYANDKREGKGLFTGWTGYVETGGWAGDYYGDNKNDMFEGYGTFTFENGDKFEGIFSENRMWNGVYTESSQFTYGIVDGERVKE